MSISRRILQHAFSFRYSLQHEQHRVPQILNLVEQCALLRTATGVMFEDILQMKPVIVANRIGHGYGVGHRAAPSVPVKAMYRAIKQAFVCRIVAPGGRHVVDMYNHLSTFLYHRCEAHIDRLCIKPSIASDRSTAASVSSWKASTTAISSDIGALTLPSASFEW